MTQQIPLGQSTEYPTRYDPGLLFPVARAEKRAEIGLSDSLPFHGQDIWTAFEVSWLEPSGKPQVAIAEFTFDCQSSHIVESKSFKLYLNSFNQEKLSSREQLVQRLAQDLSQAVQSEVKVDLYSLNDYQQRGFGKLDGQLIDDLSVDQFQYQYQPKLLRNQSGKSPVSETLYTHLLKSNCLITSQPDWATLVVRYQGNPIDARSLLQYVVSFRNHNEFHEQCVERIYQDLMNYCAPERLTVYARYTRRGGLDINPWRSNFESTQPFLRLARQ